MYQSIPSVTGAFGQNLFMPGGREINPKKHTFFPEPKLDRQLRVFCEQQRFISSSSYSSQFQPVEDETNKVESILNEFKTLLFL